MMAFYGKSEELTAIWTMYLDTSRDVVDFLCCSVDFGSWERHKGGEGEIWGFCHLPVTGTCTNLCRELLAFSLL